MVRHFCVAFLAGLLLLTPHASLADGNKVPRTADDIHVPKPSNYGYGTYEGGGAYSDNWKTRQLFPREANLYRSQLAKKAAAHYADGLAAQKVECENPWPTIITAIEAIKAEIAKELAEIEKLIKKYEAERDRLEKEYKNAKAVSDKIPYPSYADENSERYKNYWKHYSKTKELEAQFKEKGIWVVGLKDVRDRWQKDLKQVEGNLKNAKAQNGAWKKPAHCNGEDKKGGIKVGGGGTGDGAAGGQYAHISTDCPQCQRWAKTHNNIIDDLKKGAETIARLEAEIRKIADAPAPKGMSLDDEIRDKAKKTKNLRRQLEEEKRYQKARQMDVDNAKKKLIACEKQCKPPVEKGKKKAIKVGGGGHGMSDKFKPITTNCKDCAAMVNQYNTYVISLNSLQFDIEKYEKLVAAGTEPKQNNRFTLDSLNQQLQGLIDTNAKLLAKIKACEKKCKNPVKKWAYAKTKCKFCVATVKAYNKYIDELYEAEKAGDEGKAILIREKLSQANHALARCESKCTVEEGGKHILVPGGGVSGSSSSSGGEVEIELEDAHSVGGSNAFDPKDLEHLDPNQPPPPEKVELPTHIKHPVPPPMEPKKPDIKVGGGGGIVTPPPPKKPFDPMLAANSGNLRHVMGKSSCPDQLGKTSVRASDNRLIKLEVLGRNTIASANITGNNSAAPGVDIKFTCAVPGAGSYHETVSIRATDPATGESKTLSYNASVTVVEQ